MELEDKVDWLNALLGQEFPDPVDVFEDLLTERLGYHRHLRTSYVEWRRIRVDFIEAAGPRADELAKVVEEELDAREDVSRRCW